jgi:hypothetical protein
MEGGIITYRVTSNGNLGLNVIHLGRPDELCNMERKATDLSSKEILSGTIHLYLRNRNLSMHETNSLSSLLVLDYSDQSSERR